MNLETASKLQRIRKEHNLSQEDLAEKLGISRQAVSKWERAEASPDTDNLIALAKLYGISLDELLDINAEKIADESDSESNDTDDETINVSADQVYVDTDTISLKDKHGERVDISSKGIFVNGNKKNFETDFFHVFPYPILVVIIYLATGFLFSEWWRWNWILFLTIPLYYTTIEAIKKRSPDKFCYPVLAVMIFLVLGFWVGAWHPGWLIFLTIPVYYAIFDTHKHKYKDKCKCDFD